MAEKPYPLGHTYIAHKRELPLGGSGHQTCTCPRNNFLIDFVGRFGNFVFVFAEIFQSCIVLKVGGRGGVGNLLFSIVRNENEFLKDTAAFF